VGYFWLFAQLLISQQKLCLWGLARTRQWVSLVCYVSFTTFGFHNNRAPPDVAFLFHIQRFPDSNTGPEIVYIVAEFSWFSSVPLDKCRASTWNKTIAASFYIISSSFFTNNPAKRRYMPATVSARSEAWTVFTRSDAGIMGSNPSQSKDIWCVYVFILCLCCPVFR
jgi:hypothetical protein